MWKAFRRKLTIHQYSENNAVFSELSMVLYLSLTYTFYVEVLFAHVAGAINSLPKWLDRLNTHIQKIHSRIYSLISFAFFFLYLF